MRLIRVMCSGRIDLEFIFRAFRNGMDGVFIGGCRLNECNYQTHGNYHALSLTWLAKQILSHQGLDPERLTVAFMSAGEGTLFVEVTKAFIRRIKALGPLGRKEGLDGAQLHTRLTSVLQLIPYIRLVEREKLRVPEQSEEAYVAFFRDEKVRQIIRETILDRLTLSRIVTHLREASLSTTEIAQRLGFNPSETSRFLTTAARQGIIRFDPVRRVYALP